MRYYIFALSEMFIQQLEQNQLHWFTSRNNKLFLDTNKSVELQYPADNLTLHEGDLYSFNNGILYKILSFTAKEAFLYVTNKCNSNCIMCPSPEYERRHGTAPSIDENIEYIHYMPNTIEHLTVTGGEPLLCGERLFDIFKVLDERFPNAGILLLTNGRGFSIKKYAYMLADNANDNLLVGIPLHSYNPETHDLIAQSDSAFKQTVKGIKNLLSLGINVEIRIVISKLSYKDIPRLCKYIATYLPGIKIITFILMEMSGNAALNRERLWIPVSDIIPYLENGIRILIEAELDFRLYNFPSCLVPAKYRYIAKKSISPEKIRYSDVCKGCKLRHDCGGMFSSTLRYLEGELKRHV